MMVMQERKTTQRQQTPIPTARVSQTGKLSRKYIIPIEIIGTSHVVWLGSHSKDTIPVFARDLLKQITFIATAVDCIEHITSLLTPQQYIVLIISDEYAMDRKAIAHMLDLNDIQVIYIILDSSQQESIDWFFNDRRIEPIFNDTFTVLKQLLDEEVEKSTHFDEQIRNVQGAATKNMKSVGVPVSADKYVKPVRTEQTAHPHIQTKIRVGKAGTTTTKQIKEPVSPCKGFITVTGITQTFT